MSNSFLTASFFSNGDLNAFATPAANLYQRTAYNPLNGSVSSAINIGQLVTNQSQLDVLSGVAAQNPSNYYTFNLQGNSFKAAFQNTTGSANLRYQILNSQGTVIADNQGNAAQQIAYIDLQSGSGIAAAPGQYTVVVSFAAGQLTSVQQNYNFSLYSGANFNSSYETQAYTQTSQTTQIPVDNTATFATATAQLYTRQSFNQINATPATAVNIGWLAQNKSSLNVLSQITTSDSTDYYQFTSQTGNSLKMAFNNTTNTSGLRIQLLNSTGTAVLADSGGTVAQQAAYAQLTSSTGLASKPGSYLVKVTYAAGADHSKTQNYNFQLFSGTYYANSYETIASAQTLGNALLSGGGTGIYNAASAAASYLNGQSQGVTPDIFKTLSAFA